MKTVKFLPRFHSLIRSGKKIATTRRHFLGKLGDILEVEDSQPPIHIELYQVIRMDLESIACNWYREEGFISRQGFIDVWKELHPRAGYVPSTRVSLHLFTVAKAVKRTLENRE